MEAVAEAEAEVDRIIYYIFTGEEERNALDGRYIVPLNATHLSIHESITVIPAELFCEHPNIVELICHAGVKRIEARAFHNCRRLKRVIIPGVEVVEREAFWECEAVTDIECPKLEIIGEWAFSDCESLISINLPSAKVVQKYAFVDCEAMTDVKFGQHIETIKGPAFLECRSLERITIPLRNGLFTLDNTFTGCDSLSCVDLAEGEELRETVDALNFAEWRDSMNEEISSINQILPNTYAGFVDHHDMARVHVGGTARVIREWIGRVLRKIIGYKAQHLLLLDEAALTLQLVLPNDIVVNDVIPFLALPSPITHIFKGEEE